MALPLAGGVLEWEAAVQETTNTAGCCETAEAWERLDADDSPIRVGAVKPTARGRDQKDY